MNAFVYAEEIRYDEFGQRAFMRYGNGVETRYEYDPERRWLSSVVTTNERGDTFQNLSYSFDRVGNVKSVTNNGSEREVTQTFDYDDRYQLVAAEGVAKNVASGYASGINSYTQSFAYNEIGNMTRKTSENLITPQQARPGSLNYNLDYRYEGAGPHQATQIGSLFYSYDPNGNVRSVYRPAPGEDGPPNERPEPRDLGPHRGSAPEAYGRYSWDDQVGPEVYAEYTWNEQNRMVMAELDDIQVRYLYDHAGMRTSKHSSQFGETLYPDRLYQEHFTGSPPVVATKHIFVGQTRIVSKIHHSTVASESQRIGFMRDNTFTYHADHLGSTNWVTARDGNGYEHFQYTPYGDSNSNYGRVMEAAQ